MWLLLTEDVTINMGHVSRVTLERTVHGVPSYQICFYFYGDRHVIAELPTYQTAAATKTAIFILMNAGRQAVTWDEVEQTTVTIQTGAH